MRRVATGQTCAVQIEMSVSSASAKRRVLHALRELGYRVGSGPVRLAHPFAVLVEDGSVDLVARLVRAVDPTAGVILTVPDVTPSVA